MGAKKLRLVSATRYPIHADYDSLEFKSGVNVIVGELNAGKTKWLQMMDFALGDAGKPEEAFDLEIAEKYDRVALVLSIGGEEVVVERRWKDPGAKTKIFANHEGMTAKQFSEFLLRKLDIPTVQLPIGNPFSDRTWPELSWREMFRHMYKQERFWSDFAQKQADVVRAACILNFLGDAANLYPKEYGELVAKKKERDRLEAQKDVFIRVMQDIAVGVVDQQEMSVAITPVSIAETHQRLSERLHKIVAERSKALDIFDVHTTASNPSFEFAKRNLEDLHQELGKLESARNEAIRRHTELTDYSRTLEAELARFSRAKDAGSVLADLKVTHCPACDQEIRIKRYSSKQCPVCGQEHSNVDDPSTGRRRLEFEEKQVGEELEELKKLIQELIEELRVLDEQIVATKHRIQAEKISIDSAQALSVRAIPPEIALLDQETGRITAQIQQLNRIEKALDARQEMNQKIVALEEQIAALDSQIKEAVPVVDFQALGDLIGDRMNDYLNLVNTDSLSRWRTGRVSVKLRKDTFELYLDGQPWTIRAGGTANYIIQIAYHYALFSLSASDRYNYPGLLIIDFPPHFSKAGDLRGSENYLLKPFVDLCNKKEMLGAQVIIAGRAFDNLSGAHILHF